MSQVFSYTGINSANYNQEGFFHKTGNRNALVNVMARKVLSQQTRLLWQVSFSPNPESHPEKYWADVTWWQGLYGPANIPSSDGEEWGILLNYNAPLSGITGVRIIPQDNKTNFVMTVLEYYTPTQLARIGHTQ